VVLERMAAPIPHNLPFTHAAVLPLALSTAACGLFQTDQLGLSHPTASPAPKGQTVLVWGGSTSVGSNAIQLAAAAGYDIITTASPHNADYVRGPGAREVFDYRSPDVITDIVAALHGRRLAGAIAIGTTSARPAFGSWPPVKVPRWWRSPAHRCRLPRSVSQAVAGWPS